MSTICTSNLTSGFIDLATYDEQEKYMYGGDDATAYFVRDTRKSTWFTQVPVCLSKASGSADFGQQWSVSVSRAGDYLLQTWLRVQIPKIELTSVSGDTRRIRWTRNLMHNLISDCAITFNDLVAARFDNYHLDFWTAFTVPAGKVNGYNNMIGNFDDLIQPHSAAEPIESFTLNLPLPFFFTRDSGVALPTAAIPYNDMRISFSFRPFTDLLIVDQTDSLGVVTSRPVRSDDLKSVPSIQGNAQVWANYAIVSNEERKRMACAPRDILIEQVQTAPLQQFNPSQNSRPSYDIRFSHAIKVLFFAVRNTTVTSEWSNYTTAQPVYNGSVINFTPESAVDPISTTSIVYENTQRLAAMGSDYFSLVQPYYHAPVIPMSTGYHMYSYSLDFVCLDPMGSTNFGKLTNVSILPEPSAGAQEASAASQKFNFITTVVNNNIIRISGGALGFPVL